MNTIYRSGVTWWLLGIICMVSLLPILPIMYCDPSWIEISVIALLLAFIIYMMLSTRYVIEADSLYIKCGFFMNEKVNIMDITKIVPTHSFLSAPAASLDRIALYLKSQRTPVIISPRKKAEFINALQLINKDISISQTKI